MLKKLWHQSVNLIYPSYCYYCLLYVDANKPLCAACMALIKPVVSVSLSLGKQKITVYAAGAYDDPLRQLIMAKLHRQAVAARQMAFILWELVLKEKMDEFDNAVITFIPLHWTRFAWRGYNQAEFIAQELSKLSGLPIVYALKRIKAAGSQTKVSGFERSANVRDAFVLNKNVAIKPGTKLLLVDDLMTTGATLIEAGTVLKQLKPASIDALVVARALSS